MAARHTPGMIGHRVSWTGGPGSSAGIRILGFPIAVAWKFFDDSGAISRPRWTYYGFISLFPLLILISTILSVVLVSNPGLQREIISRRCRQVPVIGDQPATPVALGGPAGVVIGSTVSIYGALGVGNALQYAMKRSGRCRAAPRPNPILTRAGVC